LQYNHQHSMSTSDNLSKVSNYQNYQTFITQSDSNSSLSSFFPNSTNDGNSSQTNEDDHKRKLAGFFNDFKLNPLNFHSLDTFGCFIRYSLNLTKDQVKEIISNPQIQVWIDRNKCHGFVYQTYPKNL
jgi:hypothetical protein